MGEAIMLEPTGFFNRKSTPAAYFPAAL